MSVTTIGSLFTGYGGLDGAIAKHLGAEVAWVSDVSPAANTIIEHRFPGVPNLGDITAVDWASVEPVDIICGGSPCQDISGAGRMAGMRDGTRSNLWAQMRSAIDVIRPGLVVWENVKGALSVPASSASDMELGEGPVGEADEGPLLRALGRVLGDLTEIGYDAEWTTVPASAAGAPHKRERVFLTARPSAYAAV